MTTTRDSNKISIECNLEGYQEKLTNVLYCQWLEESSCCDLRLQTLNGTIPAHTCVIIAFSPRIAEAVSVKEQKKRKGKSLQQCIVDVKFDYRTVKAIVKSIYTGIFTTMDISDKSELYDALTWFGVEELQDIAKSLSQDFGSDLSNDKVENKKKTRKKGTSNPSFKDILKHNGSLKDFPSAVVKDNDGKRKTKKCHISKRKRKMKTPKKSEKLILRMKPLPSDDINVDLDTVKTEVVDEEIAYTNVNSDEIDDKNSVHKLLNDGNDTLKCGKCKVVFTDIDKYQSHISDHPTFTCDKCQSIYFTGAALFRHMRKAHFKSKHLRCTSCDFVASSNCEFSDHCLTVHQESEPFRCQFEGCSYKAKKYGYLSRHFEVHENFRSFQCDKCGKYFKSWACLASHRRSCYDVQKYLCDLCGQSFNHSTSMKTHRRAMHFGERPYKCHVCTKSFSENGNLKRHLRIHNNTYPYSCPVCSQPFRHSNTLKSHMNKHDGFSNFDIGVYQNKKKTTDKDRSDSNNEDYSNSNFVGHSNPPDRDSGTNNTQHSLNSDPSDNKNSSSLSDADSSNKPKRQDDGNKSPHEKPGHPQLSTNSDMFFQYQPALPSGPFHSLIDYSLATMPSHHPSVYSLPPSTSHINDGSSSTPSMANLIHLSLSGPVAPVTASSPVSVPIQRGTPGQSVQAQDNSRLMPVYPNYGPRLVWNDL